jgi:hypothetical protein
VAFLLSVGYKTLRIIAVRYFWQKNLILCLCLAAFATKIALANAGEPEKLPIRLGVATGLGANGIFSVNMQKPGLLRYRTTVGAGVVLPTVYLVAERGNAQESRFSARLGYSRNTARVGVSIDEPQIDVTKTPNAANDVNTFYKFDMMHLQVNRHFKVYVGSDSRNITSYVAGLNVLYTLGASSISLSQPVGLAGFASFPRKDLSPLVCTKLNVGLNVGWNFERQITDRRSLVVGYVITAYARDLTGMVSKNVVPYEFSDGYNVMISNLMHIGLLF